MLRTTTVGSGLAYLVRIKNTSFTLFPILTHTVTHSYFHGLVFRSTFGDIAQQQISGVAATAVEAHMSGHCIQQVLRHSSQPWIGDATEVGSANLMMLGDLM